VEWRVKRGGIVDGKGMEKGWKRDGKEDRKMGKKE